jgi:uncharacterized protein YcbK (DUF882 family)
MPKLALAALLLLCVPPSKAGDKELTADQFLENLPALLDTAPEPPEVTEAQVVELEEGDPETYIFVRGAKAHPPAPVNLGGDGRLSLMRADNRETLTVAYRGKGGAYDQAALARVNRLLRCSRTGRETDISVKLLEILDAVQDSAGAGYLTVLSAYRSPRFNKTVPGAARWSLHMLGWAADVRVPGRTPADVADFASRLAQGGVGFYPDAGFVHLDAGRPRSWTVKAKPAPKKTKK